MNLLERNIKYIPKNFNCPKELDENFTVDLEDGLYVMISNSFTRTKISDIPKQKNIVNISHGDLTRQIISGNLNVVDGQIDLEEIDNQIPEDFKQYNKNTFLTGFTVIPNFFGVLDSFFGKVLGKVLNLPPSPKVIHLDLEPDN